MQKKNNFWPLEILLIVTYLKKQPCLLQSGRSLIVLMMLSAQETICL